MVKRAKQQTLPAPGMAPEHDKEIADRGGRLADKKEDIADERKGYKKLESQMIQLLKKKGRTRYVDRPNKIEIELEGVDKLKVKRLKDSPVDEDRA